MEIEEAVDDDGNRVTTYTFTREDMLEARIDELERKVVGLYESLSALSHYVRRGDWQ